MGSKIIGNSNKINKLKENILRIAPTDCRVLILGANGSGKDLVAEAIHINSNRSNKPYIVMNCAAVPSELIESELFGHEKGAFTGAITSRPGRFERASDGTIFLDEIGDMPLQMQAKLLRVLQTGQYERVGGKETLTTKARIITATNKDLMKAIREGNFRQDLYHRIAVMPITVPTLAERKEDIRDIACSFLSEGCLGFSEEAIEALQGHDWPGNIRELKNVVERCLVLCDGLRIEASHVKEALAMDRCYVGSTGDIGGDGNGLRSEGRLISVLETMSQKLSILIDYFVGKTKVDVTLGVAETTETAISVGDYVTYNGIMAEVLDTSGDELWVCTETNENDIWKVSEVLKALK